MYICCRHHITFLCVHYKGDEWNNMIHACMILPRNAMSKPNGQHLYYSIITTSAYLIIQWVQQHLISERSELNNFLKLFFHVKKIANFSYCALILMGKVCRTASVFLKALITNSEMRRIFHLG